MLMIYKTFSFEAGSIGQKAGVGGSHESEKRYINQKP